MWLYIFISVTFFTLALTQASVSVTTSLVTITPAPSLPSSAVPDAYIGESTDPALGAYTTWYCPAGQIWSQVGNYARCCEDNPYVECGIATACLSTSLMVGPGGQQTWTCSGTASQTLCVTGLVYPSIGATQAETNVQCWPSWNGGDWTATRDVAMTSSSPIATMSTLTTKVIALTLSAHQTSTPLPSAFVVSPSKRVNTGAIVGIIIGIFLLIAVASVIVLFIHKRRQHMDRSGKGKSVPNDMDLASNFRELKLELSAEQSKVPGAHDSQVQEVDEQGHINAIHRDEDSVSVASGADVLIFQGIRVSELSSS